MRKKNYKGEKVSKRVISKCEGVCRTYDAIQYAYATLLSQTKERILMSIQIPMKSRLTARNRHIGARI